MSVFACKGCSEREGGAPGRFSKWCRAALIGVVVPLVTVVGAAAQSLPQARRILILQSMSRGSLVFDGFTADFRAALQKRAGARITLFDFVVAPAGLTETPETPIIEYLRSAYADRPPDLMVTVGGPAAAFVRTHRPHVFPNTPVIFAAVETRFLGNAPLSEHETAVTVSIDYLNVIEDILRVLPETRNVFMITGSGTLSTFWRTELQRNFERYRNRLTFIWSHDLSYDQMLQRAADLPPHSAIFYIAAGTFATGSWQGDEHTFVDLSERASAPVFGAQLSWLGYGTVGGRLLDIGDLGPTTADVVMRILDGQPPGEIRIPPRSMGPAVFDERQLDRWNIPEARLPPGSEVRFRGPSLWRDHRDEMLGIVAALSAQALLIAGLLHQRRARRRAELESRRHLSLAADAHRRVTMAALTGSMAHELSQPLNSILHNAQAGEMMLTSDHATPEVLQEILADIRTADVRATEIIERHRTMLRSHPLETRPIDMHALARESVALVAGDAKNRQIRVDVECASGPLTVIGDRVLLQQVVVNLMINAMDAMAGTPAEQRRITVTSDVDAQGSVRLSVRDAGTGLPAVLAGHLFDPFVTTKANGMGIGLTIARTIVEAHRGSITAHNNTNGGATFAVTLPRSEVSVNA